MEDTAITLTDNKRYTKVDEYEALFDEKENGIEYEAFLTEKENGIEYEERLIDFDEDYESYDPYLDWNRSGIFY